MNLLLRLLERRVAVMIALAMAAVWAALRWGVYAQDRADLLMYPPSDARSPLAAAITQEANARESAKLRGLHRAVRAELEAAASRGFDVSRLRRLADGALESDSPAYRSAAFERLNRLRLAIPPRRESFRPASADDRNPDSADAPPPRARAAR